MAKATCSTEGCEQLAYAKGRCPRHYRQARYVENREMVKAASRAWREANPERHREAVRAWAVENPERVKANQSAWRLANSERLLANGKAYRAANSARRRAAVKEWRTANPERQRANVKAWAIANPDKARAASEKWKATNPERVRTRSRRHNTNRRARIAGAFVESVDPAVVFARDGGVCQICGGPIGDGKWHIDHRMPIALGGEHSYANTQLAHAICNLLKGARLT